MEKIRMIVKSKYEEETLQYSHLANNKKKKREKEKKVYENNPYPPCFLPGFDLRISLGSKWNSELADDGLHEQIEGEAVAESELVTKDVEVLLLFLSTLIVIDFIRKALPFVMQTQLKKHKCVQKEWKI